jgi:pyruvate/2-oxoglutarate dehydrogenase complex dihydrolipoamide dehydrogenase (E3) component
MRQDVDAQKFDAIVIGAGQSGPFLAVKLAEAGWKTALIERKHLGGTCVNDGCMPTKTMVASAKVARMARRAADYGVNVGPVTVDMKAVKARKDAVVNASIANLTAWIGSTANLTLIRGQGAFVGDKTVSVNGERMTAPKIFLNVGARAMMPEWPGLSTVDALDNTSVLDLDVLPEHLIVAGGSYIGLEFAQIFRRFGARVTVVEYADRLIFREDDDVSALARRLLEAEGIEVLVGARDFAVAKVGGGIELHVTVAGAPRTIAGSHLLMAVGRKPNTDDLGLDLAGVKMDPRGFIPVDEELRTNVEGIWALGDVNGRGAFTSTSYNDFEIVCANLLGGGARKVSDRFPAYALFIDPPLARAGVNKTQARASGKSVLHGFYPMERVGRAKERGETDGFMEVLVDAGTKRILGATLFGLEADEVIHSLINVMSADAPYTVIERAVPVHPTVSELLPTLFGALKPLE